MSLKKALNKFKTSTEGEEFLPLMSILDPALGGGLPMGRIIEIFGPESSGKTTLMTLAMVSAQKLG